MIIRKNFILRIPTNNFDKEQISNIDEALILQKFEDDLCFREAVLIASPDLFFSIDIDNDKEKIDQKKIISLTKYYLRYSTRPTPFGLFSGICSGSINEETNIRLYRKGSFLKFCRYDTSLVNKIISHFVKIDFLQENGFMLYPNNTLYKILDYYFYIESQEKEDFHYYFKNCIESNNVLDKVIISSKNGLSINDLINIVQVEGYSYDESYEYTKELFDNKILVSDFEISTLNNYPFDVFLKKLKRKNAKTPFLDEAEKLSENIKISPFDRDLIKKCKYCFSFFESIEPDKKKILQADTLIKSERCNLSVKVVNSLKWILPVVMKFTEIQKDPLEEFKLEFLKKFETEEVPLLKALDKDVGINFSRQEKFYQPLFHGLTFKNKERLSYRPFQQKDILLQKKLCLYFLNKNSQFIEIIDDDLASLPNNDFIIPFSLNSIIEVYNDSIFLEGFIPDATKLSGRFSYMDRDIYLENKEIVDLYSSKYSEDVIIAEISHLPSPRDGNVIMREALSDYEIPILCPSGKSEEKTIKIKDLTIRLRDNKFLLRKQHDNRRIIPIMSCAHNIHKYDSLGIYRFLILLSFQQNTPFRFDWGVLKEGFSFLPRVKYKNFILSKAIWRIEKRDIEDLLKAKRNNLLECMKIFINSFNIPNEFVVKEYDNFVYIDSSNILLVNVFINTVKNKDWFIIEESIFSEEKSIVSDIDGKYYTNQFIINITN